MLAKLGAGGGTRAKRINLVHGRVRARSRSAGERRWKRRNHPRRPEAHFLNQEGESVLLKKLPDLLESLRVFSGAFLHGGRRLETVSDEAYRTRYSLDQIRRLFLLALVHRPGFLLNSLELSGLVHVPPASLFEDRGVEGALVKKHLVRSDALLTGYQIGVCPVAGVDVPVCIPAETRSRSAHVIGRSGTGKTTVLERNVLQDVRENKGLVLLDPHGDLIERVLRLIPEEHAGRTIYFNPGDPDYVPLWNPLRNVSGGDPGRLADDMVGSIKSLVEGWGDRLENILRYAFLGLIPTADTNLQQAYDLLRRGSAADAIRKRILATVTNENVRGFFLEDLGSYGKADLHPPQHKLSILLASGTYGEMLRQSESRIDFGEIMEQGKVLLVDLSGLSRDVADILGCFMLAVLHLATLRRSAVPPDRRPPFHIYLDEAHRFTTDTLEHLIAETRKYNFGLTLAHQFMSQFGARHRDALESVGATVIFNASSANAAWLRRLRRLPAARPPGRSHSPRDHDAEGLRSLGPHRRGSRLAAHARAPAHPGEEPPRPDRRGIPPPLLPASARDGDYRRTTPRPRRTGLSRDGRVHREAPSYGRIPIS